MLDIACGEIANGSAARIFIIIANQKSLSFPNSSGFIFDFSPLAIAAAAVGCLVVSIQLGQFSE